MHQNLRRTLHLGRLAFCINCLFARRCLRSILLSFPNRVVMSFPCQHGLPHVTIDSQVCVPHTSSHASQQPLLCHQAAVVTAHPTWLLLRCHVSKNVRPTSIKQMHSVCPLMRTMGFGMVRLGNKHPQAHILFQHTLARTIGPLLVK